MKLEDPASVIYFSPTRFNAYRDQLAQNNNPLPTLVGKKHVVRDLRKYLFDGFVFYGITFSGVTFGNLKGVTFNQCIFQECRFSHNDQPLIEGFSGASIQDTIFFECTFRATDFSGGDL